PTHLSDDDWAGVDADADLEAVGQDNIRAATVRERNISRLLTRAALILSHCGALINQGPTRRGNQFLYGSNNFQSRAHRPRGVIFVSDGIPEIDQQPVAQILHDMPGIAVDDRGTGLLVGPDYLTEFFGIELRGEGGGTDQVTEHDRELPTFA